MKRQDLNGYRTPEEVVRRWDLSKIELNTEDIEKIKQDIVCDTSLSITSEAPVQNKVITSAINNKVTKVAGKGLSTNDFTDVDKNSIHIHSNKEALDTITAQKISNWDSNSFSIDLVYPVGSIYLSVNNTNPSTLFANTTWEQIQDVFLLGAGNTYAGGSTGGSSSVTLNENQIPGHRHILEPSNFHQTYNFINAGTADTGGAWTGDNQFALAVGRKQPTTDFPSVLNSSNLMQTLYTNYAGGGQAHNNMPPYLTVYMWKRTQ